MPERLKNYAAAALLLVMGSAVVKASGTDSIPAPDTTNLITFTLFPEFDPFQSDTPIHISLEFDMKQFIRTKNKEEYHDARLRFTRFDGTPVEKKIRIRARGDFRKSHCYFPPVKLNFKKTEFNEEFMNEIKSLKLVTHCKGGETYQQYLLKEYLVYRMFNALTENSYRVRLFEIEYIDSQGKKKPFSKYGFIIESNDHLAWRINAIRITREGIATWYTEPFQTNLMTLFQYMIGNTDWAIAKLHNIRLFKLRDSIVPNPTAIPYDFDYCGMVNAHYAIPTEELGIETVRTRVYRGYCLDSDEEYEKYIRIFLEKKQEMYSLVENFALLDSRNKKEMLEYLDEFYKIIEDANHTRLRIISHCRTIPRR